MREKTWPFPEMRMKEIQKKYFNLEMERMIKQDINYFFALEMNALTSRLQGLQLHNRIVTLLRELF